MVIKYHTRFGRLVMLSRKFGIGDDYICMGKVFGREDD